MWLSQAVREWLSFHFRVHDIFPCWLQTDLCGVVTLLLSCSWIFPNRQTFLSIYFCSVRCTVSSGYGQSFSRGRNTRESVSGGGYKERARILEFETFTSLDFKSTIAGFRMTSLKFKLQNYWSSWYLTCMMYKSSGKQIFTKFLLRMGSWFCDRLSLNF